MIASLHGRTTVFFSTHILADVERVCDTVAILDRGRVVADRASRSFKRRAAVDRLVIEVEGIRWRLIQRTRKAGPGSVVDRAGRSSNHARGFGSQVAQRELPVAIAAAELGLKRFEGAEESLETCSWSSFDGRNMNGFMTFLGEGGDRDCRKPGGSGLFRASCSSSPSRVRSSPGLRRRSWRRSRNELGVVMKIPSPTWRDSYAQLSKESGVRMVLIAVVITGAGAVSGERSSGTAILTLTKPVSRRALAI